MTSSEARQQAEELLHLIKQVIVLAQDKPRRLFLELNELLEEIKASQLGLRPPDAPLNTPWSLMDTTLVELLRTDWLPLVTGREALTKEGITEKYRLKEDCISGYTNEPNI